MTSYRLFDGVSGRPGVGSSGTQTPTSAVSYSGNMVVGNMFRVTKMGCSFEGYWWWIAGTAATTAKKCALWTFNTFNPSQATLIPGSVVTSGTLSAGWNFIPVTTPIPIAVGTPYIAAIGVNGNFYDTASQLNTGDPYSSGVTNGPLSMYSYNDAAHNKLSIFTGQPFTVAGSDPSTVLPLAVDSGGDGGSMFWLDVQVRDTVAAGYAGSYRYQPNTTYLDYQSALDDASPYSLALEIILSTPCSVGKIWFLSPATVTGGLPTRCSVWSILGPNSGNRLIDNQSPSWSGAQASGWVSCNMSGAVLPAGRYQVTCYNKNGGGGVWSYKRLGWFSPESGGFIQQHSGIGTWGPLSVPDAANGSLAYHYGTGGSPANSDGTTLNGQSAFSVGDGSPTGDPFPYLYVNQSDATGQYYGIDLEVTPLPSGLVMASGII